MKDYFVSSIMQGIREQDIESTLDQAKAYAWSYATTISERRVYPSDQAIDDLKKFDEALGETPESPDEILDMLHTYGSPATVAQTGGRYFGFVCGGVIPSSLPSKWLADVWDQNPGLYVMSPIASKIESVVEQWLVDLLKLPEASAVGFVSGSATATFVGICTARNHLLKRKGYQLAQIGLKKAPAIKVVLGEGAHSTVYKALSMAGIGTDSVTKVPVDHQGRMVASKMPALDDLTLVVAQAGHVCSGAFDPFSEICAKASEAQAWVHVDGAFGLWACSDSRLDHLTGGVALGDSWSVDGHKTLNTPYDNGLVICKHSQSLLEAMSVSGSYLITNENRDGMFYTPEMSRRARAIDIWSTLKGLGRQGVADMVYEMHSKALYFAEKLEAIGLSIMNEVCFNQVLVRCQSDEKTKALIDAIQKSGVLWLGGAQWENQAVMRISVSSYKTSYEDIDVCVEAIEGLMKDLVR